MKLSLYRSRTNSLSPDTESRASLSAHSVICHQCDLRSQVPLLQSGMDVYCPRCSKKLCFIPNIPYEEPLAWAVGAVFFLLLSCYFPFLSMNVEGHVSEISLLQSASALIKQDFSVLAEILLLFVLLVPIVFLLVQIYLYNGLRWQKLLPGMMPLAHLISRLKPWMMVDVFMLGVLVSMIKMAAYAQLLPGWSFWTFLLFALTLTRASSLVDTHWLYSQIYRLQGINPATGEPAHAIGCQICGFLSPTHTENCRHCGGKLYHRRPNSLQQTIALLAAAAIFYFPANLYPMMLTESMGTTTPSTIMEGVILLWELGDYPVALVILIASVFIPIMKMLSISILCLAAVRVQHGKAITYTKLYRLTEFIGRWSMVDVFVVSVLVALVQMGSLMSIYPGTASLSFAAVVILTMLSAMSFDIRLIWDRMQTQEVCPKQESRNE